MPEDIAITSSKSDVDPCSHGRDSDGQKSADRRTDGQTAFQLYIVDCNVCVYICITIHCTCMCVCTYVFGDHLVQALI